MERVEWDMARLARPRSECLLVLETPGASVYNVNRIDVLESGRVP